MRAMQNKSNFSVTRAAAKKAAGTTESSQKKAPVMTKAQLAAVERAAKSLAAAGQVLEKHLAEAKAQRASVNKLLRPQTEQEELERDRAAEQYERASARRAELAWAEMKAIGQQVNEDPDYDPEAAARNFITQIERAGRKAPQRSTRFYPISHKDYLARWSAWLDKTVRYFKRLRP